jgi:hypothetical protein
MVSKGTTSIGDYVSSCGVFDRPPQGIRTARLPISGRVQLTSSMVLTVNQVNVETVMIRM